MFCNLAPAVRRAHAYEAKAKIAALGLGLHFVIALTAAAIYVLVSHALQFMTTPDLLGTNLRACVYAFMNCVVLRVSANRATTWRWSYPKSVLIDALLVHTFDIGLPIALVNRHYSK